MHTIDWHAPGIARVVGLLYADAFGLYGVSGEPGRVETVDGRRCVVGGFLALDVDGIVDVDATVELSLVVDRTATNAILVGHDANGTPENKRRIEVPPGDDRWVSVAVPLKRARFAGRGPRGTDILLGAPAADFQHIVGDGETLVIASAAVRLLDVAPRGEIDAAIEIVLRDEHGAPTAARVGLYDGSGREVLPSDDVVAISRYGERVRHVPLRSISAAESGPVEPRELWPHSNRWTMYVDGTCRVVVPSGTYQLIATKGPEYRWVARTLSVAPGETRSVVVDLERWSDLPARGWFSGDAHIHLARVAEDDPALLAIASAEDVGVANLLQMGNIGATYFEPQGFGARGRASRDGFHLVSGQEDPRTGARGHTLHLNVAQPVRDPSRYFLYHETFERLRADGALSGYAHVDSGWFAEDAGLALDVPFGIVDLVEVLQAGRLHTDQWYDFLNLGYRLTPVAGSDWPYIDVVGTVRSYVRVDGGLTPDRWFEALRAGHTFVTSGPILELDVGGTSMGEQATVRPGGPMDVRAVARQNPDLGPIERLELVVHGDVVATGDGSSDGSTARLDHTITPAAGCWVAARAAGANGTLAHTAPVFLSTDDSHATWRADAAPDIVERMRDRLAALLASEPDPRRDLEPWDSHATYARRWRELLPELAARVEEANRRYDELLARIARHG